MTTTETDKTMIGFGGYQIDGDFIIESAKDPAKLDWLVAAMTKAMEGQVRGAVAMFKADIPAPWIKMTTVLERKEDGGALMYPSLECVCEDYRA